MLFIALALLLTAAIAYVSWFMLRPITRVAPGAPGSWGAGGTDDPRVALAAMLYAIAAEDGPVTSERQAMIRAMLISRLQLDRRLAQDCLAVARRLDGKLSGNLNSRMHRFAETVAAQCTEREKKDVVEILRAFAGPDRLGNVREAVGRVTATLLHG